MCKTHFMCILPSPPNSFSFPHDPVTTKRENARIQPAIDVFLFCTLNSRRYVFSYRFVESYQQCALSIRGTGLYVYLKNDK